MNLDGESDSEDRCVCTNCLTVRDIDAPRCECGAAAYYAPLSVLETEDTRLIREHLERLSPHDLVFALSTLFKPLLPSHVDCVIALGTPGASAVCGSASLDNAIKLLDHVTQELTRQRNARSANHH